MKIRTNLLGACAALAVAMTFATSGAMADDSECKVLTGGELGDYYRHFGPKYVEAVNAARTAEADEQLTSEEPTPCVLSKSAGTPANIEDLVSHPGDYALLQGNVLALMLAADPSLSEKVQIMKSDVANEIMFAVLSPKTAERIKRVGITDPNDVWAFITKKAVNVKFVTASKKSGPAATFMQLMALDPEGLGKAKAENITYAEDMDEALAAVLHEQAMVAFVVQFNNPENPRFGFINKNHLMMVPVFDKTVLKGVVMPDGTNAFRGCRNVTVAEGGFLGLGGSAKTMTTGCTPMLYAAGAEVSERVKMFIHNTSKEALLPQVSGFRQFLKDVTQASQDVANTMVKLAEENANRLQNVNW